MAGEYEEGEGEEGGEAVVARGACLDGRMIPLLAPCCWWSFYLHLVLRDRLGSLQIGLNGTFALVSLVICTASCS